jgi:hypothetical protein
VFDDLLSQAQHRKRDAFSVETFALAKMQRFVLNAFATACRFAA